ncbi:MAG: amino acid permease [Anaerocolumna sp.]|jgi:L-asparagine transporter-like permease|nr:amino acid permease [Anaerocolumna sp.]
MEDNSVERKEKGLSAWQLTMMALGTVIGGSFFLGSSVAIKAAGPAIIIAYIFGGLLVYFILFALSEMTVLNPDSGSFRTYAAHAFGPGMGYVVGWVYWTGMVLAMSSEATAVSILVKEWMPRISMPLLGSAIIIVVTLLNLLGADKLSKLESGLAAVKIFAIIAFIIIALLLIIGIFPGTPAVGIGEMANEPFMPGGVMSVAGSMLIVIFSYAGFEVIGLASSEADHPKVTVPKAINYTVFGLVGLYIISVTVLLTLIPTAELNEETSPMVAALNRYGIGWAGTAINIVLITAILSTMLAAMFGLGRMMRSLAEEGHATEWLKDEKEVPYRGILFSGTCMLAGLGLGFLVPRVYLFLISSGGFALLFTYGVITATHIRFRRKNGRPDGKCRLCGFPYSSLFVLISIVIAMISMPFVPGQTAGLIAGLAMVVFYSMSYYVMKYLKNVQKNKSARNVTNSNEYRENLSLEFAEELTEFKSKSGNKNNNREKGKK